ncbi:MAG: hypothetical protein KF715_19695 [Candidatus Didemnitutus sp.]|nr:hypothetical protein [Candidatus Didemnitutus sp.]
MGMKTMLLLLREAPSAPRLLAQLQVLRDGFSGALAVLFMFGFLWGVIKIWSGANALSKGDPEGKGAILAGVFIAGAAAVMGTLFSLFGLQDSVVTAHF